MTVNNNRIRGIRQKIPSGYFIGRTAKGDGKPQLISTGELRRLLSPGFITSQAPTPSTTITLTQNHILVGNASNVAADVALSGDATIVASGALTLATVNSNVGTFGNSTHVAQVTVNAKGLVTAVSDVAITGSGGSGDVNPFSDGNISKPAAADFTVEDDTTANHGTGAAANLSSRGVSLTETRGTASTTQSWYYQAAVSNTLVELKVYIAPGFQETNSNKQYFYGIGVRDNTGKIDSFGLSFNSGVGNTEWQHFTFATLSTAPTIAGLTGGHMANGRPVWLRLKKVSTNFEFDVSYDGETFTNVATVGATSFVGSTLNDVGIILYNALATGTKIVKLNVFSFSKS